MLRIEELLKALGEARVRFVIIGGMAAVAQGSSRVTADLDLCYDRNFSLSTSAGDVDLLGEVTGLGTFEEVFAYAEELDLFGHGLRVLRLEGLIRAKQAACRPKDLEQLPEPRSLLALRQRDQTDGP